MGAPTDRRDEHRPLEHRRDPDDQTRLAPAARGEHCRFSISGEGISSSTRTAGAGTLKRLEDGSNSSPGSSGRTLERTARSFWFWAALLDAQGRDSPVLDHKVIITHVVVWLDLDDGGSRLVR